MSSLIEFYSRLDCASAYWARLKVLSTFATCLHQKDELRKWYRLNSPPKYLRNSIIQMYLMPTPKGHVFWIRKANGANLSNTI